MSEDKIHGSLASVMAARAPEDKIAVIVRYRPEVALSNRAMADVAPKYQFTLLSANALRATAQQISALAADPMVEQIWEDLPVRAWLDRAAPYINAPAGLGGGRDRAGGSRSPSWIPASTRRIPTLAGASSPARILSARGCATATATARTWPALPWARGANIAAWPRRRASMWAKSYITMETG